MHKLTAATTTHPRILSRALLAAAALLAATLGPAVSPVSAEPPPAAAGTTSHGFLAKRGVFSSIDHPYATTVPAVPSGQAGTVTTGINDQGQILGSYEGRDRVVRHFLLDRGSRYTEVEDPPDGQDGDAFDEYVDINNRGEMVGFYNDTEGFTTTGFMRTKRGRFVDISVPGSQVTAAFKINDRRQVVGFYVDATGAAHGFLWHKRGYETVDVQGAIATLVLGINNRGQMVGSYIDPAGAYHGFRRETDGSISTLPEAPGAVPAMGGTQPGAINERGQIVGLAYDAKGGSRGFLYERSRFRMIAGPNATFTRAIDINNRGRIVGDYGTQSGMGVSGRLLERARTPLARPREAEQVR
jgi:uncharacterized membrane protein